MGLTLIRKSDPARPKRDAKVAVVLAGGAVSGGAFKVGGLKALNDFLVGRKITDLDTYVGLSAGSILAASLASGITPDEMIKVLDGTVLVNDVPLKEPYIAEPPWQDYETKVPLDALFVMGDNRNNSADSLYWGPMPLKNHKGQAILIYSPLKRIHPIRSHPHPAINPSLPDPHGD